MASLRSLIVKIGADVTNVEKALASVGESAKTLDAGLKKLGTTPLGKQTQQDAERLIKSVQSLTEQQEKLAQQSLLAARGLEAVGGPARLMKSQLDDVAKSVQRGIDAFRALGQEAPAELQKVARAIEQQQRTLKSGAGFGTGEDLLAALGFGAGVGVGATLSLLVKQSLDAADALSKLSDRTGITAVGLQRLQAIAEPSGNTIEDLANAINRFQKNLAEGDAAAGSALSRIGLSFERLRQLNPDQQFIEIAKAIQSIQDPAEQTLIAMQLFGRGGAEILPSLKAKVDELADSTIKMSDASVKALDQYGDEFQSLKRSVFGAVGEIIGRLAELEQATRGLSIFQIGGKAIGAAGGLLFGGPLPQTPLARQETVPASPFPSPEVPKELTAIIKGLNAEVNDSIRAAFLASNAYRLFQKSLEEFAKIGTESVVIVRAFSSELDALPASTFDIQDALDRLGVLGTKTFDDLIRAAKATEEAFKKTFGVTAGLSLGLPTGQSPGNGPLIDQARLELQIKPAEDSLRSLSGAIAALGSGANNAARDLTAGLSNAIQTFSDLKQAIDFFGASSFTAVGLVIELGAAIGSLIARFKDQLIAAFAAIGRAIKSIFNILTFGAFTGGPGALGDAARRAARGASGQAASAVSTQTFATSGRVLPFLTAGTSAGSVFLASSGVDLNPRQQANLAGAVGGGPTIVNNWAGVIMTPDVYRNIARKSLPYTVQNIAENKDGQRSRLLAGLGARS